MVDLFERIRRVTGDIQWGSFVAVMARNVGESSDAAHEVVEQLKEWGSHLTRNALLKWTMAIAAPTPCACPGVASGGKTKPCEWIAIVKCDACGRPCCLAHARVDYAAEAICAVCIVGAKARAQSYANVDAQAPGRPGVMTRSQALKTLRLSATAEWAQIKKQYYRLAMKYNPDRPGKQQAANTERMKKINAAFEVLREEHERKAAA
jgi:hypothetical protein